MGLSKKDIQKAREHFWLKEANKQLGKNIKSLAEVEIIKKKQKFIPLGNQLERINRRRR